MQPIGKYEIVVEIGSGSMGVIYEARDPVLDRSVALKVLRTGAGLDPELKERFYREARACARLSHPNIIAVYDLGESGDALFIAMELLAGSDIRKLLKQNRTPSMAVKLDVMAQVCDALEHAHSQQLVHRDIKPSNIFVCNDNRAKVLDFGIAKFPTSHLTMAGTVLGSPNYMAPEQIRGGKCDARSDLFSAAIVFFEFVAGAHPFQDEFIPRRIVSDPPDSLRLKNPEAPEALESLLLHALEKDPDKRIQTAGKMAVGLRAIRAMVKSPSTPVTIPVEAAPKSPTAPVTIPVTPRPLTGSTSARIDTSAEQRVSEFLRVVGDFDEGIDKRDVPAARAALEQMRQLAAVDSRFVVAVSDCETRIHELTPAGGVPVAIGTTSAKLSASTEPVIAVTAPRPMTLPEPPRVAMGKTSAATPNKSVWIAAAALLFVLVAAVAFVKMRNPGGASQKPAETPEAIPVAVAAATAVVSPSTADLLDTPNAAGKRLAVLHHGETLSVIALPASRDQVYTNVRTQDNPIAGYVKTAELSEWSGANADAAFSLANVFASSDTGSEAELGARLEQWNGFIGRYPSSPHLPEANLNAGRIEFALAKLGRSAGKPAAEWQPHLDRAKQALDGAAGSPALESQVAELQKQIGEPPPAQKSNAPASPDRVLRGRVNSLMDAGQYDDAMAIVNQTLSTNPTNQEALALKNKIRAAQEAEANLK